MVEKFKTILTTIQQEKGQVSFFGIFRMDEVLDKWTVILSAPWSSETTKKEDDNHYSYLGSVGVNHRSNHQNKIKIKRKGCY